MGERNKKKIIKCYRCQVNLRSKFGVENRTRKKEDLVDRAAEIKNAEGSCSTHSGFLGGCNIKIMVSSSRKWRALMVTRTPLPIFFCFAVLLGVISRNCWWLYFRNYPFTPLIIFVLVKSNPCFGHPPCLGTQVKTYVSWSPWYLLYEICILSSNFKW